MEEFSSYPDIKRAALMAIAHKLHSNQIADLRHAFQKIDLKNTGTIDRSEFEQLAKSLQTAEDTEGKELDETSLNLIFDAADVDGTGEIAYAEFLAATLDTKVFLREDRLRDAFASLDTDGSSSITAENLASLLGKEFSRIQIEAMIRDADVKSTGNIDFEEFLLLMRGHEDVTKERDSKEESQSSEANGVATEAVVATGGTVEAGEADIGETKAGVTETGETEASAQAEETDVSAETGAEGRAAEKQPENNVEPTDITVQVP